ncbi:MAG: DUF4980 domain-containing protein [Pirellulales bacterium]
MPVACLYGQDAPIVIADFEGADYGDWKSTGSAFGTGPAQGTLPGQMSVEGFQGKGYVNSFHGGDGPTGRLVSPPFEIRRRFFTFLIGGGGWADETCMRLIVAGSVVQSATGQNTQSGGSERLQPAAWDVEKWIGKTATIEIIDQASGGWGHINVDDILQTSDRGKVPLIAPPIPTAKDVSRKFIADRYWLLLPVKNGAKSRIVTLSTDGKAIRRFDIELADAEPDWWAPLDISAWKGKELELSVNVLPVTSSALKQIRQSDEHDEAGTLYREALRPQLHFSARRGWINDPNGLVYYGGEYHLFFQHNPYGVNWGNMHWGHAVSRDLLQWEELGEALYPDELGPMFSGSAVVDHENTSGFGSKEKPPVVLIYTAAGNPTVQCIAYSTDGRHFTKYSGNPVIKQISPGNRDPKVFYHGPSKRWVMVLYVELADKKHSIHFFTSPNLREWTLASIVEGGTDNDKFLFECPDFFELPVDGDTNQRKWVLTAADSRYQVGSFDGTHFKAESPRRDDVRGRGFYAAQTYSDTPDGRRIQIGWVQAPSPGMSFNQVQSLPYELKLRSFTDGPRLIRTPIEELKSLRVGESQAADLNAFRSDLIEVRAELQPKADEVIELQVRGNKILYDSKRQEIIVNDHRAPAPLVEGRQRLILYVDRTMLEVLASDGQTYIPLPVVSARDNQSVSIPKSDSVKSVEVYRLRSIWRP